MYYFFYNSKPLRSRHDPSHDYTLRVDWHHRTDGLPIPGHLESATAETTSSSKLLSTDVVISRFALVNFCSVML